MLEELTFYTSIDKDLNMLLGTDVLQRFKFTYDPTALSESTKYGTITLENVTLARKLLSKGVASQHLNTLIEEIFEAAPTHEKREEADRDTVVMRIVDKYPIPEKYKRR